MFLLTGIAALDKKLLAYSFLENSGITPTAEKTGHTSQKLFGSPDSLASGVSMIVYSLLSLLGVVFLGLTIYAGLMWMTAEGSEERMERAKRILIESLAGLVIVLAAYAISFFVIKALSAPTLK
jgi:hypothetical protein